MKKILILTNILSLIACAFLYYGCCTLGKFGEITLKIYRESCIENEKLKETGLKLCEESIQVVNDYDKLVEEHNKLVEDYKKVRKAYSECYENFVDLYSYTFPDNTEVIEALKKVVDEDNHQLVSYGT